MITLPGQHKFKPSELSEPPCASCHQGAIYVAYGFEEGKYSVYRFPCKCTFIQGGKEWWQLDNPALYQDRPVDYYATPAELPGYVFIHPSHKLGFDKIIRRIRQIKARHHAESTGELPF